MSGKLQSLIIVGTGSHSAVVLDLIHSIGETPAAVVAAPRLVGPSDATTGSLSELLGVQPREILLAIGDNWTRWNLARQILDRFPETTFRALVHPSAYISQTAEIGPGSVVLGRAWVGPGASVGQNVIINTGAIVEHHCVVGDFGSLGPGAIMGGSSTLGSRSALGLGANTLEHRSIGSDTVIGAGSLVTRDIPGSVLAFGLPAKVRRQRPVDEPYMSGGTSQESHT